MKKLIILWCSLLCILSCQKKETVLDDSLVVCSPHPIEFINPIIKNFENLTGIKVKIIQEGTGEILQKLEDNTERVYCDVLWGGSYSNILPKKHLFLDYHSPNESFIRSEYKNREGPLTRFSDIPSVLMLNRKILGDIQVKGYSDLLQGELKGKIAFCDPSKSSSASEHLINMMYAVCNASSYEDWDYIRSFCKNLDGVMLSSSSQVYKGVFEGKYAVGLTFEEAGANYANQDDTIELVYMNEGTVFTPDGIYITKGTRRLFDARIFVDYLTDKDVQTYMSEVLNRRSVRDDVDIKGKMLSKSKMKVLSVDYSYVSVKKDRWIEEFHRLFEESKEKK